MLVKFKNKEYTFKSLIFLIIPALYYLYNCIDGLIYRINYYSQTDTLEFYGGLFGNAASFLNITQTCLNLLTGISTVLLFFIVCFLNDVSTFKRVVLGVFAFSIIINNFFSIYITYVIDFGGFGGINEYKYPIIYLIISIAMYLLVFIVPFLKGVLAIRMITRPLKTNKFVIVVGVLSIIVSFTGVLSCILTAILCASQGYVDYFLKDIVEGFIRAVLAGYMNFCFVYFCLGGNEIKLKKV